MKLDQQAHSHRRFNPLTGEWVLVSPHRTQRPWLGQSEKVAEKTASYEEDCYLCPGNTRKNGEKNPEYRDVFVFENDFPAFQEEERETEIEHELLFHQSARGHNRVVCFSPDHSKTLPQMSEDEILKVVSCWGNQVEDLSKKFEWIQVFENKGAVMGCSNPHPHCQIWSQEGLPTEALKKDERFKKYLEEKGRHLLLDYAELEIQKEVRVVEKNDDWVSVVPYWACWPYEVLLLPRHEVSHLNELGEGQKKSLSQILKATLQVYDALFDCSFPYSMGWHGRPFNESDAKHWLLHAHFYPPLLRSATVKKFMVGYEMLAEPQRDLTPEKAAENLRACRK